MITKFTPAQLRSLSNDDSPFVEWYPKAKEALRQAADDADDAERWREFIRCGWPVCFLGETYDNADDLNAAVDTARKEPK